MREREGREEKCVAGNIMTEEEMSMGMEWISLAYLMR